MFKAIVDSRSWVGNRVNTVRQLVLLLLQCSTKGKTKFCLVAARLAVVLLDTYVVVIVMKQLVS